MFRCICIMFRESCHFPLRNKAVLFCIPGYMARKGTFITCMYRPHFSVYYPDQQMHNIYINYIIYIVITATCFDASASSSGSLVIFL